MISRFKWTVAFVLSLGLFHQFTWFYMSHRVPVEKYYVFQIELLTIALIAYFSIPLFKGERLQPRNLLPLVAVLTGMIPTYYAATGLVIFAWDIPVRDNVLIQMEELIFGAQLSLVLDEHPWLGPASFFGKIITEVTSWFYVTFYFWGYILAIILGVRFFQASKKADSQKMEQSLQHILCFFCAWIGINALEFFSYLWVPARGPIVEFTNQYVNPIVGFGPAEAIYAWVLENQATREDCFPSGHTSLSWITALFALRYVPRYGVWTMVCAVVTTVATVYLRYHYIVDLLGAIPFVILGVYWGRLYQPDPQLTKVESSLRAPA